MLPIDELNVLKASIQITMEDETLPKETKKRIIRDDVEDFFLMAYMMGVEKTEETFKKEYVRDTDKLFNAMYKEFDGKNFIEEIDEYVESLDIPAVEMVADTGMTRMYSAGAFDAGEQFGGKFKRWKTMEDDRVRQTHDFINGVKVPFESRFYTFDGDSALYPGDFYLAKNNCNCRCEIDILPE